MKGDLLKEIGYYLVLTVEASVRPQLYALGLLTMEWHQDQMKVFACVMYSWHPLSAWASHVWVFFEQ